MLLLAFVQLSVGSAFASLQAYVDVILDHVEELIMKMEDRTTAVKYYEIIAESLNTLWLTCSLLTTVRGIIDLIGVAVGIAGMVRKSKRLLYIFVGVNVFDFVLDFLLLLISIIVLRSLHILYFFPIAVLLPVFLFGWQIIFGPYIVNVILSYAFVVVEGGSGTEWKSWTDISQKPKDLESNAQTEKEKEHLLDDDGAEQKVDATVVLDEDE